MNIAKCLRTLTFVLSSKTIPALKNLIVNTKLYVIFCNMQLVILSITPAGTGDVKRAKYENMYVLAGSVQIIFQNHTFEQSLR